MYLNIASTGVFLIESYETKVKVLSQEAKILLLYCTCFYDKLKKSLEIPKE